MWTHFGPLCGSDVDSVLPLQHPTAVQKDIDSPKDFRAPIKSSGIAVDFAQVTGDDLASSSQRTDLVPRSGIRRVPLRKHYIRSSFGESNGDAGSDPY